MEVLLVLLGHFWPLHIAARFVFQRQSSKAEPLYKRSLTIMERAQGPDHPIVVACVNNLADALRAQVSLMAVKSSPFF